MPVYISPAPFLHYSFDNINGNTVVDEQGNYDGTLQGGTSAVTGKIGDGFNLNGGGNKISIPAFMAGRSEFSISVWVKLSSTADRWLFNTPAVPSEGSFLFGTKNFQTWQNGQKQVFFTELVGQWSHRVLTFSASNQRLRSYTDGVLTTEVAIPVTSTINFELTELGGSTYPAIAGIDQLRFYDFEADESLIQDLFTDDGSILARGVPDDYIAHYTCDSITGSTLNDETGSYDAAIVGASVVDGVLGDCLQLNNAANNRIDFPVGVFDEGNTISFWLWIDSAETDYTLIGPSGSDYVIQFGPSSNKSIASYHGGFLYDQNNTHFDGLYDQWVHVVIQHKSEDIKVWLNSNLIISGNVTFSWSLGASFRSNGANAITSKIEQIRSYSRDLYQSEIDSLYTEGSLLLGLQAHYTMDNIDGATLFDETGNYDGTITGATQVDGHLGKALSFPTISGAESENITGITAATVACASLWIKTNQSSSNLWRGALCLYGISDADRSIIILGRTGVSTNVLALYLNGDFISSDAIPQLGVWKHVVVQYDGAETSMYVDGVKQAETTTSNLVQVSNLSQVVIGNYRVNNVITEGAGAEIDQVRLYDRGLEQVEIDALYYEQILSKILAGTITETLGVENWHVRCYRVDNGILTGTIDTIDGTFSIDVGVENDTPHVITVTPDQGVPWKRNTNKIIGQLVYPSDPATTPYYYKVTVNGQTGQTEPTWPTQAGQTVIDGGVTWECVERLVQPMTHGPLLPI